MRWAAPMSLTGSTGSLVFLTVRFQVPLFQNKALLDNQILKMLLVFTHEPWFWGISFWTQLARYDCSNCVWQALTPVHLQIKILRSNALNTVSLHLFLLTLPRVFFLVDIRLTHDNTLSPALALWQCQSQAFWSKGHLQARMPHYNFPGGLLRFWKFWRSKGKDEVQIFFFSFSKTRFDFTHPAAQ